jgi:hypothetical protein
MAQLVRSKEKSLISYDLIILMAPMPVDASTVSNFCAQKTTGARFIMEQADRSSYKARVSTDTELWMRCLVQCANAIHGGVGR